MFYLPFFIQIGTDGEQTPGIVQKMAGIVNAETFQELLKANLGSLNYDFGFTDLIINLLRHKPKLLPLMIERSIMKKQLGVNRNRLGPGFTQFIKPFFE